MSLMAVCCKVCEHIVATEIVTNLEAKGLLSDFHYGFCQLCSCEKQLLLLIEELARSMCDEDQVDMEVMDFFKVFDVMASERLLMKLTYYSI